MKLLAPMKIRVLAFVHAIERINIGILQLHMLIFKFMDWTVLW